MKRIEITVSPTGETQLETKGFSGASCQQASRFLEQALGTVASEQRTAEFYAATTQQRRTQLGNQAGEA